MSLIEKELREDSIYKTLVVVFIGVMILIFFGLMQKIMNSYGVGSGRELDFDSSIIIIFSFWIIYKLNKLEILIKEK